MAERPSQTDRAYITPRVIEDSMTNPLRRKLSSPLNAESETRHLNEEWQPQLMNLQHWVCELLIRNEQLRMALHAMKAEASQFSDSHNSNHDRQ
jgi:hypothetical protein